VIYCFGDWSGIPALLTVNIDRVAKSPFLAFCSTESEKCYFRFPYESMTYDAGH